ncbi:hypothetical protein QQS21_007980 [Conoideocrella luteorostrata]|uniref:Uncharacterized protein n=1 Tax=Conoideocrella luteorostrata TaxID=1105319 RepID=A0AAJ0CJR6_9HYPO|nr:hypothetical protein QQS21_007980 [Conoideocrella luteorostrata]
MPPASSPQQDIQRLLARRSLTIVPKDQQEILDTNGSWVINHAGHEGSPQVPAHVLETVTQTYLLRRKHGLEVKKMVDGSPPASVEDAREGGKGQELGNKDIDVDELARGNRVGEQMEVAPSSPLSHSPAATLLSWSPSPNPSPSRLPPVPQFQSQIIQETPRVDYHNITGATNGEFAFHQRQAQRAATIEEEDEEDEEDEEEEMEMEAHLPDAHISSNSRVNVEPGRVQIASTPATNITTQPQNNETPSCAQPQVVIPGTAVASECTVPPENKPQSKLRTRFQPIEFTDIRLFKHTKPSSLTRLPTTSRLIEVESSLSTSSSSLIPATLSTQNPTAPVAVPIPISQSLPTVEQGNQRNPRSPSPRTSIENLTHSPSPTKTNHTSSRDSRNIMNKLIPPQQHNKLLPQNIYTHFTSTYPSYTASHSGSLKNFIKAAVCLEFLQSERSLHECLYDDFIRSLSAGYLNYVRSAGPGQEPLPAIEWFNMLDGQPLFTQMVITKGNLKTVLDAFPDEVAHARSYISGRSERDEEDSWENKKLGLDGSMDVDTPPAQTPDVSPPGPAKHPRRPAPPSPELGSDAPELPRLVSESSSKPSQTRGASQYFKELRSVSRSNSWAPRSADSQARLREHFRKKKARAASSLGSRPVSQQSK